jgi:hypothetical protein
LDIDRSINKQRKILYPLSQRKIHPNPPLTKEGIIKEEIVFLPLLKRGKEGDFKGNH